MCYFNKKLWLIISTFMLGNGCKSNEKAPITDKEQTVVEQPKPITEPQTDSLKKSLDEQRRLKNSKP
ncbi:hypothetical protein AEM51_10615 [Bacteroidetes bacterium UKL13-3]|jgi:uncharacterized protein YcfL|nr:hypothetical protein AEM51_10615 [Bacteroidetes bacterium UKL13-3]HCP93200.1 hypothetical protein [Bacteroidota bacterium]